MFERDQVKMAYYDALREVLKNKDVDILDDETLDDYGVDSLDKMNLLLEIEQRLGIDLGDIDLGKYNNFNLIFEFVSNR